MSHPNQAHVDANRAHDDAGKRPSWKTLTNLLLAIMIPTIGFFGSKAWDVNNTVIQLGVKVDSHTDTLKRIEDKLDDCVTRPELEMRIHALKPGAVSSVETNDVTRIP